MVQLIHRKSLFSRTCFFKMHWFGFLATIAAICCAALGDAPQNYVETGECAKASFEHIVHG